MNWRAQLKTARGGWISRRKLPQDLVSVDFDAAAVRCARCRLTPAEILVTALDLLPAVDLADPAQVRAFKLPKALAARYTALCIPGYGATIKLLNLPGSVADPEPDHIREQMGLEGQAPYRLGYRVVSRGQSETKLLTVAIPEAQVRAACEPFASGPPVPVSVEISALAGLTAFLHGPGQGLDDEAVGVIKLGSRLSYFAFFKRRELILIRKFEFGHLSLLEQVEQTMGVDRDTARNIVTDRSFDVSQLVKNLADPFIKQLIISKHFVERRENCQIARLFMADDPLMARNWRREIKAALGMDTVDWKPFGGVRVMPDALPERCRGNEFAFNPALGAVLAIAEDRAPGTVGGWD